MSLMPISRSGTTYREEKEATLRTFIMEAALCEQSGAQSWTLLARNLDSPVVRALAHVAQAQSFAGINIRAVVLECDTASEDVAPMLGNLDGAELRIIKDQRFAAAHEQLVIGSQRAWIGDCMRRDPAKRDAFELFHADNMVAVRHAEVSFEKIWAFSKPVTSTLLPRLVAASRQAEWTDPRQHSRR